MQIVTVLVSLILRHCCERYPFSIWSWNLSISKIQIVTVLVSSHHPCLKRENVLNGFVSISHFMWRWILPVSVIVTIPHFGNADKQKKLYKQNTSIHTEYSSRDAQSVTHASISGTYQIVYQLQTCRSPYDTEKE